MCGKRAIDIVQSLYPIFLVQNNTGNCKDIKKVTYFQ